MRDDKAPAAKKPRKLTPESDDDDEKASPSSVKQESVTNDEGSAPVGRSQVQQAPAAPGRLVILAIKTSFGMKIRWPLSEDIVSRIPVYASELIRARSQAPSRARLMIFDEVARDELLFLSVLEYLMAGFIRPVDRHGEASRVIAVKELLSLRRLAMSLQIRTLADEIDKMITKQGRIPSAMFVAMAKHCCDTESGMDVSAGSVVGEWIRKYLATHLIKLRDEGHIHRIKEQGGKLTGILVDVLMETSQQQTTRLL